MNFIRRAILYSIRKKWITLGMFLLSAVVSAFLICCFSILNGTEALAADIRRSIGAAFYIRANSNVVSNDRGEIYIEENDVHITDDDIARIEQCGDIAYCNPINYGYAKSGEIAFIPGEQDAPDNSMGQVTALCYSSLHSDFGDQIMALSDGRHIIPADQKAILISSEAAKASGLSVGDKVTLRSAEFGVEDGKYTDVWPEAKKEAEVSIIGIYDVLKEESSMTATAAKRVNHIYASLDVLQELGESEPSVYTGEVDFYVIDPAELARIIPKVRQLEEIDWKTHFIRTNDFRYSKISDSISSLGSLVRILLISVSAVSTAVLTLILTLRIRNRIQEAGIFLAAGISKGEILMQFLFETLTIAIFAFAFSYAAYLTIQGSLANSLFADVRPGLAAPLGIWKTLTIYLCQLIVMSVSVVISSLALLRLKPREILRKR